MRSFEPPEDKAITTLFWDIRYVECGYRGVRLVYANIDYPEDRVITTSFVGGRIAIDI